MHFYIDEQYLTSITVRTEHPIQKRKNESKASFLVRKLKEAGSPVYSIKSEDHPEFVKLREELGAQGYIQIQRGWWNGDSVMKPFYLNDRKFKPNEQFSCAPAMRYTLTHPDPYDEEIT